MPAAIVLIVAIGADLALAASRGETEAQFRAWLAGELWPRARDRGVSARRFNQAFAGVRLQWDLPDLVPPGTQPPAKRAQSQAEFRAPAAYFNEANLRAQAARGSQLAQRWAPVLGEIEARFGVPGRVVIAIWGRESAFGRAPSPHPAVRVLATKAFMSTRKALFTEELLAALEIIERGETAPAALKGSWAGAMGQPQFLPSSYLRYAVDFDRDGVKDIWNSVPDTLASIANYLASHGWQAGRDWGYEARIPQHVSCAQEGPDRARPIRQWVAQGINRISGRPFPDHEIDRDGMMLVPAGRHGPAFVVTPNFYVLKAYNNSDLYALYVGNLADRIAYGSAAFVAPWRPQAAMLRSDIARAQRVLEAAGHDVGGADGLPGYKTRRSIGAWQEAAGRDPTCFPDPALLKDIR